MPVTPSLKLPRRAILRRRSDFEAIRKDGSRAVHASVVCNYLVREGHPVQVGFIVGRACGGAVVRNWIKRRMREIYRQFLAPGAKPGLQIVWIARQNAARVTYAELKREMLALAAKAGWPQPGSAAGAVGENRPPNHSS